MGLRLFRWVVPELGGGLAADFFEDPVEGGQGVETGVEGDADQLGIRGFGVL